MMIQTEFNKALFDDAEVRPLYSDVQDYFFGVPGEYALKIDAHNNTIFLSERPRFDQLGIVYGNYYTKDTSRTALAQIGSFGLFQRIRTAYIEDRSRVLSFFLDVLGAGEYFRHHAYLGGFKGCRILDVGCGNGSLLANARTDNELFGIEIDADAAAVARENGLKIIAPTIDSAPPEHHGQFDVVLMSHYIEHSYSPIEDLRKAGAFLAPGGRLIVITPNVDALSRRIFGKYWRGYEVPRHIHIFSTKALKRVFAGLHDMDVRTWTTSAGARAFFKPSLLAFTHSKVGSSRLISGLVVIASLFYQVACTWLLRLARETGDELVFEVTKK